MPNKSDHPRQLFNFSSGFFHEMKPECTCTTQYISIEIPINLFYFTYSRQQNTAIAQFFDIVLANISSASE